MSAAEDAAHEDFHRRQRGRPASVMRWSRRMGQTARQQCSSTSPQIISPPGRTHPATVRSPRLSAPAVTREPRSLSPQARSRGKQQHKGRFVRAARFPQRRRSPACGPAAPAPSRALGSGAGCGQQTRQVWGSLLERGVGFLERGSEIEILSLLLFKLLRCSKAQKINRITEFV